MLTLVLVVIVHVMPQLHVEDRYREGVLAWAGESHGSAYLAVPWGAGRLVEVCAAECVTLTSTDAGPTLAMQRAGRIGDLAVGTWEHVCDLDRSAGLCRASIRLVDTITLPPTDAG